MPEQLLNISGVLPHLAVKADHHPRRTETGIGALMPWAGRLWFVTYVAHKAISGGGTGLFSVDDDFRLTRHPESVVGTYADRMIHHASDQPVSAGVPSDPYLMTGFDRKCLHLCHDADKAVNFTIQVDFLGSGAWKTYGAINVDPGGYEYHVFPAGFSAHWVRVIAGGDCAATAYFTYT